MGKKVTAGLPTGRGHVDGVEAHRDQYATSHQSTPPASANCWTCGGGASASSSLGGGRCRRQRRRRVVLHSDLDEAVGRPALQPLVCEAPRRTSMIGSGTGRRRRRSRSSTRKAAPAVHRRPAKHHEAWHMHGAARHGQAAGGVIVMTHVTKCE